MNIEKLEKGEPSKMILTDEEGKGGWGPHLQFWPWGSRGAAVRA
jgi:hypothetical protein